MAYYPRKNMLMKLTQRRFLDGEFDFPSAFGRWCRDLSADLFEENGVLVMKMTLPGMVPEEIAVALEGDTLTVSGSREEDIDVDEKEYYSKEIRRGSFYRSVHLPKTVEVERAAARYQDGVLTVELPIVEQEERPGTRIPVQEGAR